MNEALLDAPVWNALGGLAPEFVVGNALARRYRRGITQIGAVREPSPEAYAALRALVEPGEAIYVGSVQEHPAPAGWIVEGESVVWLMVCREPAAARAEGPEGEVARLGEADVDEMLALTALTQPGPFARGTHRLGTYLGIRREGRLVAMAGERMRVPGFREISAVCTHPDWQGRGLARRLIRTLATQMLDEGDVPFLHVVESNVRACRLYEELGFRARTRFQVRVLAPGPG